jgi:hypothetical protein
MAVVMAAATAIHFTTVEAPRMAVVMAVVMAVATAIHFTTVEARRMVVATAIHLLQVGGL